MGNLALKIATETQDEALFKETKEIFCRYELADDNQLLQVVDAIDEFWEKYKNDNRTKPVFDSLLKESLCKPMGICNICLPESFIEENEDS
jgi:hypothetical protein